MKNSYYYAFLMVLTLALFITGCDKGKTGSEGKKPVENEKPIENTKPIESEKPMADIGSLAHGGALMVPNEEEGAADNNEGVGHYKEGHWDVAEKHFNKAIETAPDLAEAHYNLALTLDKLGNHGDATKHFRKALELAPDNQKIKDSKILKDHLGI